MHSDINTSNNSSNTNNVDNYDMAIELNDNVSGSINDNTALDNNITYDNDNYTHNNLNNSNMRYLSLNNSKSEDYPPRYSSVRRELVTKECTVYLHIFHQIQQTMHWNMILKLVSLSCLCVLGVAFEIPKDYEAAYAVAFNSKGETLIKHTGNKSLLSVDDDLDIIFINISSALKEFQLKFIRNVDVFSPAFQVHYQMPNNNSKKESSLDVQMEENIETNNVRACFYRGSLIGEDDSYAALSICGGLSGIIQTSLGDFIIQPYPDSKEASSTKYGFTKGAKDNRVPLILYRMSSLRDVYHDLTNDFHHKHQHHKRRTRRSSGRIYYNPNRRYTVELFVVVDKEALVKIQHINPTTFVLNLFNMVGMYYAQKSLGIQVHIAVTDILFMRRNEPEIIYRKGPGYTLNNFCRWIYDQRYRRQQFDHAVLLTGQKMCPGTHCNSVGYGRIGDMCMERSSCSLVRLRGLHSALIAAHEIGHSFGLEHDHPLVNGCNPSEETIMKPQITKHTEHYVWSHCSRDSLHKFLRSKDSFCLLKTSDRHYRHFDDKLPGENYEADMQCKLRHGPEYRYCSDLTTIDLCSQLWCVKGNQPCNSGLFPAAAGTPCGRSVFDKSRGSPQLWCLDYKCVPKDPNFKFKDLENFQGSYINGYWENWSAWSGCPTECGGGIRMRTRLCLKRQHQIGKPRCNGPSVEQGVCNLNKCRPGIPDPREKQCRSFNGKVYMGARWIWSAYREFNFGKKQCMLYCVNNNDNKAHRMRYAVDDGTLCNTISNDVCIKGVCTHVGCDLQLNSTARLDRCCVCGGDGSSCTFTRTTFNAQGKMYGIVDLVVLPEGACSCSVTCGKGYKRRRVDCMQKVNRRWTAMPETVCSHSHKPQSTRTCRTRKKCPKTKRYQWVASAWGECSKSCGYGGLQRKILRCTRYDRKTNSLTPKPNKNCQHIPKPKMILTRKCAQQNECSKWTVSSWTRCSQSCGMYGVQTRAVKCVVNEHWQVNPLRCRQSQKPQTKQRCNTFACPTATLESSCTDVMGWCYVAVARNMCESPLIKKRCCKSCSTREQ
ncbi:disintegrin and metalloproteinase with thrombospondin motifs 16-like [Octopus vulgaris]|nr:disintegrin and metalloproteinase with thrombospondin motifs 16-like [Octopus vulgaris]